MPILYVQWLVRFIPMIILLGVTQAYGIHLANRVVKGISQITLTSDMLYHKESRQLV